MTIDRTADLFHDLLIKPEIERCRNEALRNMHLPNMIPPSQRHSVTSQWSAMLALPKAGTQRRRVYDFLVGCGPRGATDDEMQARLGMNPSTQRPRRIELWRAGLIKQKPWETLPGLIKHRKTASGRDAVVWVAV